VQGTLSSLSFFDGQSWPEQTGAGSPSEVSVLIAYPRAVTAGPVDVVIFQHGFGGCKRHAVLAIANALAAQGLATVGIDAMEHGARATRNEKLLPNEASPGICDTVTDEQIVRSGENFIRFENLKTTRDYIRQTVIDQVALTRALQNGLFNDFGYGNDFVDVRYGGLSLGGVIGTLFLDAEPSVATGALTATGAWLSRLFVESPYFSAALLPMLAKELNHTFESPAFQDTLWKLVPLLQGLLDPADPAYYAQNLTTSVAGGSKRILLQQVEPDDVLPASATEFLGRLLRLPEFEEPAQVPAGPISGWTLFSGNLHHGVLLEPHDPSTPGDNFRHESMMQAMQEQFSVYLASDGFELPFR
jgi:hypothetical protein